MVTILVTAPSLAPTGLAALEKSGCRTLFVTGGVPEIEELMSREPIDAVISRTLDLTATAINACKTLKVISKHGAGVNNIDIEAATHRRIPVFFTPGANAQAVAELTIGLIIAIARKIIIHDSALHNGGWTRSLTGLELRGRTMGIVGYGQIGSRVAHLAEAFGMRTLILDPFKEIGRASYPGSIHALLPEIDVLSVHCPLTSLTRGMIGAAELALLKPTAILINTARGGIVDEAALIRALETGALAGAALDSFAAEPLPADHPLRSTENLILTPHIGGSTDIALGSVALTAVTTALEYLEGAAPDAALCVNPAVLSQPIEV